MARATTQSSWQQEQQGGCSQRPAWRSPEPAGVAGDRDGRLRSNAPKGLVVFVPRGGASIATVSQLGIGLTVPAAAALVRIVLLPDPMPIVGEKIWWLPKWMDRALPRFDA